jgi:hypothetical protein
VIGGEDMSYGGHGVGTPLASRPSLSPGGVARAARRPSSAHALPTLRRVVLAARGLGSHDPLSMFRGRVIGTARFRSAVHPLPTSARRVVLP